MMIDVINRERLSQAVIDEIEAQGASLNEFLAVQHDDTGAHTDVTADTVATDSVTLPDGTTLEVTDDVPKINVNGAEFAISTRIALPGYPPQDPEDRLRIHDPAIVSTGYEHETISDGPLATEVLRLLPATNWALLGGGGTDDQFQGHINAPPPASLWRLTSGSALEGIYATTNTGVGMRGQVLVAINRTGGDVTITDSLPGANNKKILGGNQTLLDDGVATFVYDDTDLGWQILAMHHPGLTYKTGTFTPTLKFGGGNTGWTSTLSGSYTKIGRQVTCIISGTVSVVGSSTGTAVVGALPYTVLSNASIHSGLIAGFPAAMTSLEGFAVASSTNVNLYYPGAGGSIQLIDTDFSGNESFIFTVTYFV